MEGGAESPVTRGRALRSAPAAQRTGENTRRMRSDQDPYRRLSQGDCGRENTSSQTTYSTIPFPWTLKGKRLKLNREKTTLFKRGQRTWREASSEPVRRQPDTEGFTRITRVSGKAAWAPQGACAGSPWRGLNEDRADRDPLRRGHSLPHGLFTAPRPPIPDPHGWGRATCPRKGGHYPRSQAGHRQPAA